MKSTEVSIEIDAIKDSLLSQKSMILNRQKEFKTESLMASLHIADESEQSVFEQNQNLGIQIREKEIQILHQIEKALSRIADGTYGQCECCTDPIGLKRLQARPFTTLCISCKEEQESVTPLYQ
jgi:DnaK suppressor protein